jgi:hypothetical protein
MKNKLFTLPKLYHGKDCFVYYSYRHPDSGKMQRVRVRDGFGSLRGKALQVQAQKVIAAWTARLQGGYDPFAEGQKQTTEDTFSIAYYLSEAQAQKHRWRATSKKSYDNAVKFFKEWLTATHKTNEPLQRFSEDDAADYLDWLENHKNFSATTRNNHRGFMATIFNAIKKLMRKKKIVIENYFLLAHRVPEDRQGRTPFNARQAPEPALP